MGQGYSILMCMSDSDDRKSDFRAFRSMKKAPGHTVHLINGVPHLSSPWPVSTDSSLYFSPSPVKFENDPYIISPFDIMSPSLSRDNEMTVVRLREIACLVQEGDLEGLKFEASKWHLQYRDIRVDNTPLLHIAVKSNHFQIVKFLLSQNVDIDALDQDDTNALDHAINCKDLSIYPYLKTVSLNNESNIQSKFETGKEELLDPDNDKASVSSSSTISSYLTSMGVKQMLKKGQKKMRKERYLSANVDGEESVDDDKSPRKGRRTPSRLVSEQLLSPLSQSTTETTYSSILESDHLAQVDVNTSVLNYDELAGRSFEENVETNAEVGTDKDAEADVEADGEAEAVEEAEAVAEAKAEAEITLQKHSDESKEDGAEAAEGEIHSSSDEHATIEFISEADVEKTLETREISGESQDVKISPEHSMSTTSSFVTAKTTYKSPAFKKMKKVAGRALSFVAGGKGKAAKSQTKEREEISK